MSKIYIVEDDTIIRRELEKLLTACGYVCETYEGDYTNVTASVLAASPELLLLDVNLPFLDGYHVCREIRKESQLPIIMVTSRDSDLDELMGMQTGADDFVTKPYNSQILLARMEALLRRSCRKEKATSLFHVCGMEIDFAKGEVTYEGRTCELTKNENRILQILTRNVGCIVSREEIMEELWQSEAFVDDNTLTVNMNRLRHLLEEIGAKDIITTKRGQGYLLVESK